MTRSIGAALLALSLGASASAGQDPAAAPSADAAGQMEVVTLEEAIRRATSFDPEYIQALGRINNAEWSRRAALAAFVLPTIQGAGSWTKFSSDFFNIGTGEPSSQIVQASLQGSLPLFRGGGRIAELNRSGADLRAATATEVLELYQTALDTETDYYDVLSRRELVQVAAQRLQRAEAQLGIARARVVSGAAVQSDSLQLLLEVTRARVDLLTEEAQLRVARFQLGRRVGADGPVDAAPFDATGLRELPIDAEGAVAAALAAGPDYRAAVAEEERAQSALSVERSAYSPQVDLFGQVSAYDTRIFPDATVRSSFGVSVSVPLWTGGQREVRMSEARVARDVASARRFDIERSVRRDVAAAYAAYVTARAVAELESQAVEVATENLRVQESRYRGGATTILDLLTAQVDLTEAEARLVQARYTTWLALAGLEALLGRRLFDDRVEP